MKKKHLFFLLGLVISGSALSVPTMHLMEGDVTGSTLTLYNSKYDKPEQLVGVYLQFNDSQYPVLIANCIDHKLKIILNGEHIINPPLINKIVTSSGLRVMMCPASNEIAQQNFVK